MMPLTDTQVSSAAGRMHQIEHKWIYKFSYPRFRFFLFFCSRIVLHITPHAVNGEKLNRIAEAFG